MTNKYIKILTPLVLLSLIICILISFTKKINNQENLNSDKIYACSIKNGIYTIDADTFSVINETKIKDIFDIAMGEDGTIYGIQDNLDPTYKEVFVFKDDKIETTIPLTYDILDIIKYNEYDKNVYVSQTSKITNSQENCITIIDTKHSTELKNIMYEDYIYDFTFDEKGNIIAISNNQNEEKFKIDIIDINENKIIETINLDSRYSNIYYKGKKIFLTQNTNKVTVYNLSNNEFDDIILDIGHALTMNYENNKLYVLHTNEDDLTGKYISIINLEDNSTESKLLSQEDDYNHITMHMYGKNIITSNFKDKYIYNVNSKKKLNLQGVTKLIYSSSTD